MTLAFSSPYIRVRDKDANMAFFEEVCGFKLHSEENALAIYGDKERTQVRFNLEESPASRTRAAEGKKKLALVVIKVANPEEIQDLLARGFEVEQVYQGKLGYAFSALSPEGDRVLLHAEDDRQNLVAIERPEFVANPDFSNLTDFQVEEIILNVPELEQSQAFYDLLLAETDFKVSFQEAAGEDLTVAPNVTWDLEILEFVAPVDTDLSQMAERFSAAGYTVFLAPKARHLVISDPSQIEIWIVK